MTIGGRTYSYCRACHNRRHREWRATHPLTAEQRYKDNARSYANVYKQRGELIPAPCERCGDVDTEMHHDDYDAPLDVRWLCRSCHLALHAANPAAVKALNDYLRDFLRRAAGGVRERSATSDPAHADGLGEAIGRLPGGFIGRLPRTVPAHDAADQAGDRSDFRNDGRHEVGTDDHDRRAAEHEGQGGEGGTKHPSSLAQPRQNVTGD